MFTKKSMSLGRNSTNASKMPGTAWRIALKKVNRYSEMESKTLVSVSPEKKPLTASVRSLKILASTLSAPRVVPIRTRSEKYCANSCSPGTMRVFTNSAIAGKILSDSGTIALTKVATTGVRFSPT